MDTQVMQDRRLGELLIGMGFIDESELRAMLALQAALLAHHGSGRARAFRLGTLLVDSGVMDEQLLNDVLEMQAKRELI